MTLKIVKMFFFVTLMVSVLCDGETGQRLRCFKLQIIKKSTN
jgi:hypothetical protein